jgi:glycosyltransferase involved in cell wall biosynthesis
MLAPSVSGAEHQTLALCRYLAERWRVTLLVNDDLYALLRSDAFLRSYTAPLAIETVGRTYPAAPARTPRGAAERAALYPRAQLRLARAIRRLGPDVVHLVLAPSFFAYLPLFRTLRPPTVMTLAGEMRYVRHFYGVGKRLAVRAATRLADGLIACSEDELENLRRVEPRGAERAIILDNFTDVARGAPGDKDPHLVTFAARLHPEKGPLLFLDAAAHDAQSRGRARFALYGRGELEGEVERAIRERGLTGRVERGYMTDLAPHFARSSVFVSCQRHENLGSSSLLEAMASGNAVVATDVGRTGQIVDDEVGVRVPSSPGALADAIRSLLDDGARRTRMGGAARRRVLERYGPGPYVERLVGFYEAVLAGRRAARG